MTESVIRRALRGSVAAAAIGVALALGAMLVRYGTSRLGESDVPIALVVVLGFGAIVWVGAAQQPGNRLLWVLTAHTTLTAIYGVLTALRTLIAPEVPFRVPIESLVPAALPSAAAWLEGIATPLASVGQGLLLTFGLLLFPDGALPSRRWRPVGRAIAVLIGVSFVFDLIIWHPGNTTAIVDHPLFHLQSPVLLTLPLIALVSVVFRFRRVDATQRARLKWIVWGMAVFVPMTLVGSVGGWGMVSASGLLVLIASYGLAISKHRLFDVDVVISKTLVYGSLAAFLGLVYVGFVVGVGSLVGSGDEPNPVLAVGATSVVAVAFQPVRRRLERVANRVVFGRKATPYEVLSNFSHRVAVTSDDILSDAARSLAEGTRAERVAVAVMVDGVSVEATAWPQETSTRLADPVSFPIVDGDMTLGSLDVFLSVGQELRDDDRRLVEQLAAGMGLALRNQLLTERLAARVEELRESRRRLVAVQDDTRRRLERDLHDGAQQQLVALKVKLGLGRTIAERDGAADTAEALERLSVEAGETVDAMREFARGVYPPLLEAEGLKVAIEAHARRLAIPVGIRAAGLGRQPREIESTVYFCVLEALRNTVQHSEADRAEVSLTESDGMLEFRVRDDGCGFDASGDRGVGLIAMADRLDALTGEMFVDSGPGVGTTLIGRLPLAVMASR